MQSLHFCSTCHVPSSDGARSVNAANIAFCANIWKMVREHPNNANDAAWAPNRPTSKGRGLGGCISYASK